MSKYSFLKVSIIIPLYVINDRFFYNFKKFQKLNYSNYEILVVSDKKIELPVLPNVNVKLILTNKIDSGPAEKRDKAIKYSKADLCAFIDDDAYPDKNWLKNAVPWFNNHDIAAVGGPGLTPPDDLYLQKIGGNILESFFCSGGIQNRYFVKKGSPPSFVIDWPAYNLIVRTNILKRIKGYGSTFYGGEDTLLCLKMIKYGKIIYDANAIVYHHRRVFPIAHLRQIKGIAIHRGYFFKKYPETSRSIFYLLPTFLTLGLFLGIILSIFYPKQILPLFILTFTFFWMIGTWSIIRHNRGLVPSLISGVGIIFTHVTYGIFFVIGLVTRHLTR